MTADIRELPRYSKGEEIANSTSHLLGFVFSVATLVIFIVFQIQKSLSFSYMLPFYVYSFCMMVVFFVSAFYHSSPFHSKKRAVSRIIDHCDIYAFVAATYFPICVHGMSNQSAAIAIMIVEVVLAVTGIVLNAIPNNCTTLKVISYLIYIIDGWILIFFYPFGVGLNFNTFLFVLIGGIVYSAGAIIYAIGKKRPWFHTIFHIFVVLAAILQFIGIYFIIA